MREKSRARNEIERVAISVLWLLLPLLLFAIHEQFGFTDALMGIQAGENPPRWQMTYNLVMVLSFSAAPIAAIMTYLVLMKSQPLGSQPVERAFTLLRRLLDVLVILLLWWMLGTIFLL